MLEVQTPLVKIRALRIMIIMPLWHALTPPTPMQPLDPSLPGSVDHGYIETQTTVENDVIAQTEML